MTWLLSSARPRPKTRLGGGARHRATMGGARFDPNDPNSSQPHKRTARVNMYVWGPKIACPGELRLAADVAFAGTAPRSLDPPRQDRASLQGATPHVSVGWWCMHRTALVPARLTNTKEETPRT